MWKMSLPPERRGVDILLQALEADSARIQIVHGLDQVRQRASQAVEFPDHQRIAGLALCEGRGQAWPLRFGATDRVGEEPLTPCGMERVDLQIEALVAGRHPGIADTHRHRLFVSRSSASVEGTHRGAGSGLIDFVDRFI